MTEQRVDKHPDSEEGTSQPESNWPIWVKLPVWILSSIIFGIVGLIFIGALIDETDFKSNPAAKVEAPSQISNTPAQSASKIVGSWKCQGLDYNGLYYFYDATFTSSGSYVGYSQKKISYEVDGNDLIFHTEHGVQVNTIAKLTKYSLKTRHSFMGKNMGSDCTRA